MVQQKSIQTQLKKDSRDKFYKLFRDEANRLGDDICPNIVLDIHLTDDTKFWEAAPGNRKKIKYRSPSGATLEVKDVVKSVHDASKTIIYKILEGPILPNISEVKLEVTDKDVARWTVYYENTTPEDYLNLLDSINQAVDNYINK